MEIRIYQIDGEKDTHRVKFDSLQCMKKYTGKDMPDAAIYENVYEGNVHANEIEDVYTIFNTNARPGEFRGHSLSVSDVVEVVSDASSVKPGFYYCDTVGFKPVEFDSSLAFKRDDLIKVVLMEPGQEARIVEIGSSLREMQCVVQGHIEAVTLPFKDNVCLICNEEGKLIDLPPNRALPDPDSRFMSDVIAGTCFICGVEHGEFVGLSDKQLEHYKELFLKPQEFTKNRYGEWRMASSLSARISEAAEKSKDCAAAPEKEPVGKDER